MYLDHFHNEFENNYKQNKTIRYDYIIIILYYNKKCTCEKLTEEFINIQTTREF